MNEIESTRTRLRRFQLSDLNHMRELESDPEIMKFTPSRVPHTPEQTQVRLQASIEKQKSYSAFGIWAAELKENQDFVGWFMLLETELKFPELGFMIPQRQWGKGYATEVAGCLLNYGFQILNLKGIFAKTTPDNVRSIGVLEKIGFEFQNVISVSDKVLDRNIDLNLYFKSKS